MKFFIATVCAMVIIRDAEAQIALIQKTNGEVLGPYMIKPLDHAHRSEENNETTNHIEPTGLVSREDGKIETIHIEPEHNVVQNLIRDKMAINNNNKDIHQTYTNFTDDYNYTDYIYDYKNPDLIYDYKNPDMTDEYKNPDLTDEYKNPDLTDEYKNPDLTDKYKNADLKDDYYNNTDDYNFSYLKYDYNNPNLTDGYNINMQPTNVHPTSIRTELTEKLDENMHNEKETLLNSTNFMQFSTKLTCSSCTSFKRNHTQLDIITDETKPEAYSNITGSDDPKQTLLRQGSTLQLICFAEKILQNESDLNITFFYEPENKSTNSSSLPVPHSLQRYQNTSHHILLLTLPQLSLNQSGLFQCKVDVNCCEGRTSFSVQHRLEVWDPDLSSDIWIMAGIAASLAVFWAVVTFIQSRRQRYRKQHFIKNVLIPSSLNDSNTLKSRVMLMRSNDSLDSFE